MKIKELNTAIDQILEEEAKRLIKEQIKNKSSNNNSIDIVRDFQTLSGLSDKIVDVKDIDNDKFGVIISINGIDPNELVNCCGGASFDEAQKNLMQGLHHDLEDNGLGSNFDIDIDTEGENDTINIRIKITVNDDELSGGNNSEVNEKKEVLLGDKNTEDEVEEGMGSYWGAVAENKNMKKNNKMVNKKRVITLNESDMKELLTKIIKEGIPGIDTTNRVTKDAGKQNADALKDIEKKIKKYLKFEGNDNPEFPNQIGGEKKARHNSPEEDEIVDDNRGRGPQDLDYDQEPSKEFTKRLEKGLTGDSKMGNSQDAAGVIKTKTGENMIKNMKRRKKIKSKEPIYAKEPVPVNTKVISPINEEVIQSEIKRMKDMTSYNKKTQ